MKCLTTTHWATHYTPECAPGGTGNCEGTCDAHGNECSCPCHTAHDLPDTVEAVRVWHDERNDVVASFTDPDAPAAAVEAAKAMTATSSTREYTAHEGQGRHYVTWRNR